MDTRYDEYNITRQGLETLIGMDDEGFIDCLIPMLSHEEYALPLLYEENITARVHALSKRIYRSKFLPQVRTAVRSFVPYDYEQHLKEYVLRHAAPGTANGQKPRTRVVPVAEEQWREDLLTTNKNEPKETANNIGLILANHAAWKDKFWWDDVRGRAMIDTVPLNDEIITEVAQWLGTAERMPARSLRLIERCVIVECRKHPRDLLHDWLESLPPWDGVPRLDDWLVDVGGVPKTAYGMAVSRIIPLSMVARVMEPGCLYRYVVILEGAEEAGKSTLVRAIAGQEWYVELSMSLESKESHMMLQGAWVAELAELDSLSRTEETRLKAFITLTEDSYVPKYSNNRLSIPRRAVFIGTTNEESYLKGQTGNTRFLPIKVHPPLAIDDFLSLRNQLFAEAYAWYQDHVDTWWQLPEDALTEARHARELRRVVNVYEHPLREWLDAGRFTEHHILDGQTAYYPKEDEIAWADIARWFLKMDSPERWKDMTLQKQIATALRALGWVNCVERDQATQKTRRVWRHIHTGGEP